MKPNRSLWLVFALTFVALLASVALNITFFVQGRQYYLQLNETRLDPLGLSYFTSTNGQPDPADLDRPAVVFFGDSRAADWPAPNLDRFDFINRGIGAQTSSQALLRFDDHVTPLRPRVVALQIGVNDLKTLALFPERKEVIIAACKDNIRRIVGRAGEIGATVILTTIFPVGEPPLERMPFWSSDISRGVDEVNGYIRSLAAPNVVVLDAYAILA
jgi:hypothetical protein